MKQFPKTMLTAILMAIKLLTAALILLFPSGLMMLLYPFSLFSPLFIATSAYGGFPKWLLLLLLGVILFFIICLIIFTTNLFIKRCSNLFFATMLIVFFLMETLCFLLSLFFGAFVFGKIIGAVFNIIIVVLLWQTRPSSGKIGNVSKSGSL